MSDIAGPPVPKPLPSSVLATDRAAKSSRDPNQTPRQTTDDSGEKKSKSEQRDSLHAREPAVSISASAAHLRIGEELKEHVREIDAEGRPIIVTETATFALRPDAGLKPGDDVLLHIVETGKSVAADLLRHNERFINPPIRLSLVVIAIHNVQTQGVEPSADALEVAYRPTQRPNVTATAISTASAKPTDTDTLAQVLSRSTSSLSLKPGAEAAEGKLDPLIKSNSSDMATLLAAQQNQPATPNSLQQKVGTGLAEGVKNEPLTKSLLSGTTTTTRVIPSSPLTDPAATLEQTGKAAPSSVSQATQATAVIAGAGQGHPIAAITLGGNPVQIQLLDPAISQVAPAEVAEVISVQPLAVNVARALPVSAQALGNDALARLETNKGTFILPQAKATSLAGELIRFSNTEAKLGADSQTGSEAATKTSSDIATFSARLLSPGTQGGRAVQVQFAPAASDIPAVTSASQSPMLTTVDAVHTVRAFLTAEGPKSDLRIDTALGTLTATMTNSARPVVGDAVAVLPNASAASAAVVMPSGAETASNIGAGGWPSFEQAYALIQSGLPAATSSMDTRSAQGGHKLLNSMMFLIAAIKGGSPAGWIGRTAEQAIEARSGGMLAKLKEDLARLFSAGAETSTSEWRSLVLPFDTRASDMPMLAALFSQQQAVDPDEENTNNIGDEETEHDQRFVIEVQFSVLGAIQLDGIVRSNRFDLTLWSNQALPTHLIRDTNELFETALGANGFTGSMNFKQSETFPVDVATILKKQLAA